MQCLAVQQLFIWEEQKVYSRLSVRNRAVFGHSHIARLLSFPMYSSELLKFMEVSDGVPWDRFNKSRSAIQLSDNATRARFS